MKDIGILDDKLWLFRVNPWIAFHTLHVRIQMSLEGKLVVKFGSTSTVDVVLFKC
jgi:hypothetical protein